MARKSRLIAGAGALVATLLWGAPSASAGIVIIGETPPQVNLIIAGVEDGLFVQHGPAGDTVQIDGHGFTGATAVDFGSTPASFTVLGPGYQIEAVAPPGEGTVPVTVTTPGGTSTPSFGDYFTYVLPPPPAPAPAPPTNQSSPPIGSAPSASAVSVPTATEHQPAVASAPAHPTRTKPRHRRKRHRARKHHRHHRGKRRKRARSAG